jgi:hypothetical protein
MVSQKSTDDAQLVIAVADRLRDELLPKVSGPIQFTRRLTTEEAEVGGWYVSIAQYNNIHIVLFFGKALYRCFR